MNTIKGKAAFKPMGQYMQIHNFNGKASFKISNKKDAVVQWCTQDGNVTTNINVEVDCAVPALSAMNVVTWK